MHRQHAAYSELIREYQHVERGREKKENYGMCFTWYTGDGAEGAEGGGEAGLPFRMLPLVKKGD